MAADLPRRAFLGARLPPDTEAFSRAGMRVAGVVAGGVAAGAGLEPGDRLTAIAGAPVRSLRELAAALRRAGGCETVELAVERGAASLVLRAPARHWPREQIPEQEIAYGVLEVPGARLRTIITRPLAGPPRAAVLVIQGIACESIEGGPEQPMIGMVQGWARAGIITMRLDKRGVGDSEGGPCAEVDFETEVADFRAALAALIPQVRAAGVPLYLFGHSVGGMIAAVLAGEQPVDGVLVYGTSTDRWLDCVAASTARQQALRGMSAEAIDRHQTALRDRVLGEGLNGRTATYHRQLDALDLTAAWSRARAPRVLVLRGEHDWVVGRAEQERITEVAAGAASLACVPGLDHLLGWHPSREASLRDYGAGRFDPAVVRDTLAWMLVSSPS